MVDMYISPDANGSLTDQSYFCTLLFLDNYKKEIVDIDANSVMIFMFGFRCLAVL